MKDELGGKTMTKLVGLRVKTYNIQKYTFIPNFTKMLWDHGGSNPWEKPRSSNDKTDQWLIYPGKPRAVDNMQSFYDLSN